MSTLVGPYLESVLPREGGLVKSRGPNPVPVYNQPELGELMDHHLTYSFTVNDAKYGRAIPLALLDAIASNDRNNEYMRHFWAVPRYEQTGSERWAWFCRIRALRGLLQHATGVELLPGNACNKYILEAIAGTGTHDKVGEPTTFMSHALTNITAIEFDKFATDFDDKEIFKRTILRLPRLKKLTILEKWWKEFHKDVKLPLEELTLVHVDLPFNAHVRRLFTTLLPFESLRKLVLVRKHWGFFFDPDPIPRVVHSPLESITILKRPESLKIYHSQNAPRIFETVMAPTLKELVTDNPYEATSFFRQQNTLESFVFGDKMSNKSERYPSIGDFSDALIGSMTNAPHLKSFTSNVYVLPNKLSHLLSRLNVPLEKIVTAYSGPSDISILRKFSTSLKTLDIRFSDHWQSFVTSFPILPTLEVLDYSNTNWSQAKERLGEMELRQLCAKVPNIKTLKLSNRLISANLAPLIRELLPHLKTLEV